MQARAMEIDSGRFTFVAYPRDAGLAKSLLPKRCARDTFPGLPRPLAHARILITPDALHFHEAIGPSAPEWGAAIATPESGRIVMQGSRANSRGGRSARDAAGTNSLTSRCTRRSATCPRAGSTKGMRRYAAGELARDDVLATNIALAFKGVPSLDSLDAFFQGGESQAQTGYALARRAVSEIAGARSSRAGCRFFFSTGARPVRSTGAAPRLRDHRGRVRGSMEGRVRAGAMARWRFSRTSPWHFAFPRCHRRRSGSSGASATAANGTDARRR